MKNKVSIIIPTYNRQNLIEETLNSLKKQTYNLWEAIIIDDRSNDNTKNIISKYSSTDNRIKQIIKPENLPKGAQYSRNLGIKKATGEYIIFLDSDDLLAEYCLQSRVNIMNQYLDVEVGIFPQLLFYSKPNDSNILVNRLDKNINDLVRFLKIQEDTDVPWVNNSPIWRTSVIKEKRLEWDINILKYQDIDFHLQIFYKKINYKKFEVKPDCFWREHDNQRIGHSQITKKIIKSNEYFVNKIYSNLKTHDLYNKECKTILTRDVFFLCIYPSIKNKFYFTALYINTLGVGKIISPLNFLIFNIIIFLNIITCYSDRLNLSTNNFIKKMFGKSIFIERILSFKNTVYIERGQ